MAGITDLASSVRQALAVMRIGVCAILRNHGPCTTAGALHCVGILLPQEFRRRLIVLSCAGTSALALLFFKVLSQLVLTLLRLRL